jgi:hypothetical protein
MTTVCPVNPPGHDWQNGLACRWCDATRTPEEAILSQLAALRGFTRALRPAARYGDLAEVQKLIAAHAAQEAAARQDTATPATGGTR